MFTISKYFLHITLLLLFSCSNRQLIQPENIMDHPDHHMLTGQRLLEKNNLEEAFKEFNRALELDVDYAPGYAGLAICYAIEKDYKTSKKYLRSARKKIENDLQKAIVETIAMRIFIIGGTEYDKKWLKEVENSYDEIVKLISKFQYPTGEPFYYMGIAYMNAFFLDYAETEFSKVLKSNDASYFQKAEVELNNIRNLKRELNSYSDPELVSRIATVDALSRGELAALLNSVFNLKKLFPGKISINSKTAQDVGTRRFTTYSISDFESHSLKNDVTLVLSLQIRGLSLYSDRTFRPDREISRGEFALVLEDIIIAFTGDTSISRKYFGNKSQFIDVSSSDYYFNAVNVSVNQTELKPKDGFNKIFNPTGTVSGGEAIHILLSLKRRLAENALRF